MTETKPKRRWFRFSLRTLFVLTALSALASWWIVGLLNWKAERKRLIAEAWATKALIPNGGILGDAREFLRLYPNRYHLDWRLKLVGEDTFLVDVLINPLPDEPFVPATNDNAKTKYKDLLHRILYYFPETKFVEYRNGMSGMGYEVELPK